MSWVAPSKKLRTAATMARRRRNCKAEDYRQTARQGETPPTKHLLRNHSHHTSRQGSDRQRRLSPTPSDSLGDDPTPSHPMSAPPREHRRSPHNPEVARTPAARQELHPSRALTAPPSTWTVVRAAASGTRNRLQSASPYRCSPHQDRLISTPPVCAPPTTTTTLSPYRNRQHHHRAQQPWRPGVTTPAGSNARAPVVQIQIQNQKGRDRDGTEPSGRRNRRQHRRTGRTPPPQPLRRAAAGPSQHHAAKRHRRLSIAPWPWSGGPRRGEAPPPPALPGLCPAAVHDNGEGREGMWGGCGRRVRGSPHVASRRDAGVGRVRALPSRTSVSW